MGPNVRVSVSRSSISTFRLICRLIAVQWLWIHVRAARSWLPWGRTSADVDGVVVTVVVGPGRGQL